METKVIEPGKLTKEKQLEIAFKKILTCKLGVRNIGTVKNLRVIWTIERYQIPDIVKELLTEVKIRTKL